MSKERLAGLMMGIGLGVAIGYYLRPPRNEVDSDGTPGTRVTPATPQSLPVQGSQAGTSAAAKH